jgi:hypothetical protein
MRDVLMAEFGSAGELVGALKDVEQNGGRAVDAFTPYPISEIDEAMGAGRSTIARYTLAGGVLGALTGYLGQYWILVVDYPLNVGGRPLHSAPAMIPVTFELTVLFAALATVLGLAVRARLGLLWQPVDETPGFESASVDRFWLAVAPNDGQSPEALGARLVELGALRVSPAGETP